MSQSKKIFTRMCLNNWGGINHKVLQFNEYVNLFSGKSGSGKSTVMDAIQVILYGSFSPTFLNKAAKNAKNTSFGCLHAPKRRAFSASRSILCAFGQANLFYNSLFQLLVPFCFQWIAFLSKIAYTIFEQNAMH